MSSIDALTKPITRTLSGVVTVTSLPSRALMVRVLPSTFSIVPRMRTGGAFCAQVAADAVITATPSAPATSRAKLCRMMSSRFDRSVLAGRVSTSHLNTGNQVLFRQKQPSTPVRAGPTKLSRAVAVVEGRCTRLIHVRPNDNPAGCGRPRLCPPAIGGGRFLQSRDQGRERLSRRPRQQGRVPRDPGKMAQASARGRRRPVRRRAEQGDQQ